MGEKMHESKNSEHLNY